MSAPETVICPVCQRQVKARVPRHGDGSALRLYQHNANGFGQPVKCSGSNRVFHELTNPTSGASS